MRKPGFSMSVKQSARKAKPRNVRKIARVKPPTTRSRAASFGSLLMPVANCCPSGDLRNSINSGPEPKRSMSFDCTSAL